ncbi:MAG TPA: dihydroorotate dehydrogenase electron transfer subunit, partial [Deltaproteobacteria bacterium]|nr:dihydroorotate dehydrogenase electron transfer subunit [Deltaproteobacteria bacterium]
MNDVLAVVKGNRAVARDTFLMDLDCALEPSLPGQFLMVKVSSSCELFLRRPLAILGQGEGTLEILYKLKGEGTLELSRKKPGDVLWVLGPLGNCFSPPQNGESALFVAGGTGLPPVLALASRVGSGSLVIGARSKEDIPL